LTRGFTNNQLRFDANELRVGNLFRSGNTPKHGLGCNFAHLPERLPNRRETRVLENGALDIVETDYRNVFGHAPARFAQGADRPDGGLEAAEGGDSGVTPMC